MISSDRSTNDSSAICNVLSFDLRSEAKMRPESIISIPVSLNGYIETLAVLMLSRTISAE